MPVNAPTESIPTLAYKQLYDSKSPSLTAGDALRAYIGAFTARDADFMALLFKGGSLAEIPLLKPNRLFGTNEIQRGHHHAFKVIEAAVFSESQPLAEAMDAAIWVGTLVIRRVDHTTDEHELGIVAEVKNAALSRLSLHFNARNIRRWCDCTIL